MNMYSKIEWKFEYVYKWIMLYGSEYPTLFALVVLLWRPLPQLRSREDNTYQYDTRLSAQKFSRTVYTLFHFLHDIINLQMTIENTIFKHHIYVSPFCLRYGYGVTID